MSDTTGTITTHLAPGQPSFATATATGGLVPDAPTPRDPTHLIWSQPYMVNRAGYVAATPASTLGTTPQAYCIGDSGFAGDIDDTLTYTRRWSTIPADRVEPGGTYAYPFPAFPTGAIGTPKTVTAMTPDSAVTSTGYVTAPVFDCTAHGYSAGTYISLALTFTLNGTTVTTTYRALITAVTTNTFTVAGLLLFINRGSASTWNFTSGTVSTLTLGRENPRTIASDTVVIYSYALPGVTSGITTEADFRADTPFVILDTDGNEVTTTAAGTTPSATAYRNMVATGASLVVQSTVTPYLGSLILERRTTCVRAQ